MPKPARTAIVHALRGRDGRRALELSVIAISKFMFAFENSTVTLKAHSFNQTAPLMAHSCSQLPNSRSAAVQARPVVVKDIAGFMRERYGRCRISSVRSPMSRGPAPPRGSGAVGDRRRDTISGIAGDSPNGQDLHGSSQQARAQVQTLDCCAQRDQQA